jgi:hypothetical protein
VDGSHQPSADSGSPYGCGDAAVLTPETAPGPEGGFPEGSLPEGECAGGSCHGGGYFGGQHDCAPQETIYADAQYLLWWLRGGNAVPPLVGRLPVGLANLSPADLPPSAIVPAFGGDRFDFRGFSGGRFTAGVWLDPGQCNAIEGDFLFLSRRTIHFAGQALPGNDSIFGPIFFDATNGRETIIFPTDPAHATERALADAAESLWGYEVNWRGRVAFFSCSPLDIFAGYRYLNFDDKIAVNTATDFAGFGTLSQSDGFAARNQFFGGQVGGSFDIREGPWSVKLTTKVAVGDVRESVTITGSSVEFPIGGVPSPTVGGVLAQFTNIGHFHRDSVAALPEFAVGLGYEFNHRLRLSIAYNLLYLSEVLRAHDAMDFVNPAMIRDLIVTNPTTLDRPVPVFRQTDLLAQGVNFGLEYRY